MANGFSKAHSVQDPSCGFLAVVAAAVAPAPPAPTAASIVGALQAPAISHPIPTPNATESGGGGGASDGGEKGLNERLAVLEWRAAYGVLCADAHELGIPSSAIPRLPEDDSDVTLELVQSKQQYLQDMVASFLSAGL